MHPPIDSAAPRDRAFSLVELVVVLLIIGVLGALAVGVASRVAGAGKRAATEGVLQSLDAALDAYVAERGAIPPKFYSGPEAESNQVVVFPVIDARDPSEASGDDRFGRLTDPGQPSLALAMLQMEGVDGVDAALQAIDDRFISRREVRAVGARGSSSRLYTVTALVVNDAWGNPIRYVHPGFDGGHGDFELAGGSQGRDELTIQIPMEGGFGNAQTVDIEFRRSFRPFTPADAVGRDWIGDADEGVTPDARPYFYSAGPDGDPGTREDNIYSRRPRFPPETADAT